MCFTRCFRGVAFPDGVETCVMFLWLTQCQHNGVLRSGGYSFEGFEKVNFSTTV
jgi:hypothetical protein